MSKMSDLQVQIQEVETISKKAVIDAFKVWLIDNNDMRRFEEVVKDLKPVAQKKHECDFHADWQPISDGLLPDAGEYFVTWEAKNSGSRFIEISEYFMNEYGDMVWDVSRMEANGYHDIKIIAWMDMPVRWEGR